MTESLTTVPNQKVLKVQMALGISAFQEQAFDIRNAAGVPVYKCAQQNPKEPYNTGKETEKSQKLRDPSQRVKEGPTERFPPMISVVDAQNRPVYEVT